MSTIISHIEDNVCYITLNRPEKFNSFNREMCNEFKQILDHCYKNEAVRALYITAEGKAFCAGQDLGEVVAEDGPDVKTMVHNYYNPIIERMRNLPKPIVVAVNGVAAGAGANIALCGDVVVAKETATFIQAFSKIGLIPDCGGTYTLPRIIGFQKASALMMLADNIDAKEAERLGMIYTYYPEATFVEESKKLALKLAAMPTVALANTKQALNESMNNSLTQQLALEEQLQSDSSNSDDFNEGIEAFLAKRKPVFTGK